MTSTRLNKKIKSFVGQNGRSQSVTSIARSLGKLSLRWLDRNYSFRKKARQKLVKSSHFTGPMADQLLDSLFQELTQAKLLKLLKAELGDPKVLDGFRRDKLAGRSQTARGPKVITHIFSGNIPNPAVMSFVLGMLVKSVNIGKTSSKDEGILNIYLESLKTINKNLAKTNSLIDPADRKLLIASMESSDLVIAYGDEESLKKIRPHVPVTTPFVGYGHRVSFGIYTKEALSAKNIEVFARKTAHDIWISDQRGCLSPIEVFVEAGGSISAVEFSNALSQALGKLFVMKMWRMPDRSGSAQVIGFGGKKVVAVRSVKDFYKLLVPFQKYLQAVSLETGKDSKKRVRIAEELSRLGVNRVCRAGRMQFPPVTWHHDGKWNLASWVNWTDLEG